MKRRPTYRVVRRMACLPAAVLLALLVLAAPAHASGGKTEIGKLKIKFTDWDVLDIKEMRSAVEDDVQAYLKHGLNKACLDDAAYHLKTALWEKGHPFAQVKAELAANGLRLRFHITPGHAVELRHIIFLGNRFFPDEKLEKAFEAETVLPFGLDGARLFVRSRVEDAAGVIRNWYRNEGFLWARVTVGDVEFSAQRDRADITIKVAEGLRAHVVGMSVDGCTQDETALRDALGPLLGKPFSPHLPFRIRNVFLAHYAEEGFPFCRVTVTPEVDQAKAEVFLRVRMVEGRRCTVRQVLVKGNSLTIDGVIRHIADFEEGELFRLARVRKAINDLMRTGLFRSVDIKPRVCDAEGVDLEIKVDEADDFQFELSVWFDNYEWLMGKVKIRNHNLFGTGRSLWLAGKASFKELSGEVVFSDPWFFNLPLATSWKWFVGQRIETTFTEFHWGTRFSVGVPLFDWLETGLTYSYEFTDVYDVDPGVDATASRDLIISALGIKLHFHVLDNRFDPKWGFDVDLLHEFGGRSFGGEVHYDRSILEASVYVTPFLGITLAVHGWASIVDPKSITEEIPLQRRIYRGGAYSVRSFNFDKLGPKSADGVPLGGEGCLQLNIELRIPIYGPVGIALFFDTASLRQNAAQWLDFVDFRHGLGVGLRLNSPVGPLRLDFGLNPDRRPDEDLWSLHFTVGHAF